MFRLIFILGLFGYACGGPLVPHLDDRIVGGSPTEIESHPYQLSFRYLNRHRCGASLIKPNVALTAAHCTEDVKGLEAYLTVRAGSSWVSKGGQIAKILIICDHPKYDKDILDYDVSVLLLNQSLALGAGVQTISLQPENLEIPAGSVGAVTGWGRLSNQGPFPEILHVVYVPKVEHSICINLYQKNATVTNRMICFGKVGGGKDSCEGDSGGPLVISGRLVGVVSWGLKCAAPRQPGVYAKISNPEINSHIKNCLTHFRHLRI